MDVILVFSQGSLISCVQSLIPVLNKTKNCNHLQKYALERTKLDVTKCGGSTLNLDVSSSNLIGNDQNIFVPLHVIIL